MSLLSRIGLISPMPKPILYIKPGCPWCTDALDYFRRKQVALDVRDVIASATESRDLLACSGQSKCPTFKYGAQVKADFGVDEFEVWAKARPELCQEIGLKL